MNRIISSIAAGCVMAVTTASSASALDKFNTASVDCEQFFLWQRTPVLSYDIVPERVHDYDHTPAADYFRQAAERTRDYCSRQTGPQQNPLGPNRRIVGIWFQSRDNAFKILFNTDSGTIDGRVGIVDRIGDRVAEDQRQKERLEDLKRNEERQAEIRAAQQKAFADRQAAQARIQQAAADEQNRRGQLFLDDKARQLKALNVEVRGEDFVDLEKMRANPYHYEGKVSIVHVAFNRMVSRDTAMFGNEFDALFVKVPNVDLFTKPGQNYVLASSLTDPKAESLHVNFSDAFLSAFARPPLTADYVGAYECPQNDCRHLLDIPAGL